MGTYFKSGSWNAVCDVCGFVHKSHELRKRWDGMMVCSKDWESRHPIDFRRAPQPERSIPWSRPDSDSVVSGPVCTVEGRSAFAGKAVAGCSVAGLRPAL